MREALLSHLVRIQPEIMFGERSKLLSHDKAFKRLWQINIFYRGYQQKFRIQDKARD